MVTMARQSTKWNLITGIQPCKPSSVFWTKCHNNFGPQLYLKKSIIITLFHLSFRPSAFFVKLWHHKGSVGGPIYVCRCLRDYGLFSNLGVYQAMDYPFTLHSTCCYNRNMIWNHRDPVYRNMIWTLRITFVEITGELMKKLLNDDYQQSIKGVSSIQLSYSIIFVAFAANTNIQIACIFLNLLIMPSRDCENQYLWNPL